MVYCSKCGTLNADDANVCKNCGTPMQAASHQNYAPYYHNRHPHHHDGYCYHRRSGWGALFVGLVIILIGSALLLSQLYGFSINWSVWYALFVVFIGIWLIFVAFRRRFRYYRAP